MNNEQKEDGALFVINMAVQRRDQEALHQALSNPQAELPYIHQKWSETYLHALVEEERARMPTSILVCGGGEGREKGMRVEGRGSEGENVVVMGLEERWGGDGGGGEKEGVVKGEEGRGGFGGGGGGKGVCGRGGGGKGRVWWRGRREGEGVVEGRRVW